MNVVAIIQARCGSTRFPNKIFSNLCGKPLIWHVINRLKYAKSINAIVLATTTNKKDDILYNWAIENNVNVYRGSEDNVLNRYYNAALYSKANVIVRITADDPFKEPLIIDEAVNTLIENRVDFVCNNNPPTYPEGLDVEVFTIDALKKAEKESINNFEREHVTQYLYHNPTLFKIINISNTQNLSYLRWTIDTEIDFQMVEKIYNDMYHGDNSIFHMNDILQYLESHPSISKINLNVHRSVMYKNK